MLSCNATPHGPRKWRFGQGSLGLVPWLCTALALVLLVLVPEGLSNDRDSICGNTAQAALNACRNAAREDYWTAIGNCANVANAGERNRCLEDAEAALREHLALCEDRLSARTELCGDLGEARYEPDRDPADFAATKRSDNPAPDP